MPHSAAYELGMHCLQMSPNRPQGYQKNFMLNSRGMNFFLLVNDKMPTIVGILSLTSRENRILGLSEPEKS